MLVGSKDRLSAIVNCSVWQSLCSCRYSVCFFFCYFTVRLHINALLFCCEVRQVPLPFSRPTETFKTQPVTVKEQTVFKPPANTATEAVSKVGANITAKQAASSESKKSAKSDKKQGIVSCHYFSFFAMF